MYKDDTTTALYQELQGIGDNYDVLAETVGNKFNLMAGQMRSVGMVESNFKPTAKNTKSTASGLFQFVEGTWKEQLKLHGAAYGIPSNAKPTDPVANTILAGKYMQANALDFKNRFAREPEMVDIYLGHLLGNGGRARFTKALDANPNDVVTKHLTASTIKANNELFFRNGKPITIAEARTLLANKLEAKGGIKPETTGDNPASGKPKDIIMEGIKELSMERVLDVKQSDPTGINGNGGIPTTTPDFRTSTSGGEPVASFVDAVSNASNTIKQKEEGQPSLFDGTWEAIKAEVRLSTGGRYVTETLAKAGLKPDYDPAVDMLAETFRQETGNMVALPMDSFSPFQMTPAQVDRVRSVVGDKWIEYVSLATSPQEITDRVQLALNMQKADDARKGAGLGGQLVGGVAGALGDPLSVVSGGAAQGVGIMKPLIMAGTEAMLGSVASEWVLEKDTNGGVIGDYLGAAAGGFTAGFALKGLGTAFSNLNGATRMEARADAAKKGADVDPTDRPDVVVPEGKPYADHPTEDGAVVMPDGTTHSATDFGNPKMLEAVSEFEETIKPNWGVPLGDLNTVSFKALRSDKADFFSDFFRSETGIVGGGSGKSKMVVEDIHSRLSGLDNMFFNKTTSLRDEAWRTSNLKALGGRVEDMDEAIVKAIETGDQSGLSPQMVEYSKAVSNFYQRKLDEAQNISMWGNGEAPPIFSTTRDPAKYFPQIFEEGKRNAAIIRFDGAAGLKDEMIVNWKAQYDSNHNGLQSRFQQMFDEDDSPFANKIREDYDKSKTLDAYVEAYIEKKAYGISHQGDFTHASSLEDANLDEALSGVHNNNFTKERNLFDSSYEHIAKDGQPFSINQLRHFDIMNISNMYSTRMNGDIALHAGTGKTTQQLKDEITSWPEGEARTIGDQAMRIITGRSRVDSPPNAMSHAIRSLQDYAMFAKGAKMWINGLTEASGWGANRLMHLVRNIPDVGTILNPEAKFSKADLKEFGEMVWGHEFNNHMTISYKNLKESLQNRGSSEMGAKIGAGMRAGASNLVSQTNPYMKLLSKSTEALINVARGGVLNDIMQDAMFGKIKFNPTALKFASVTDAQYEAVKKLLKDNTEVVDGKFKTDYKAVMSNPHSNTLWRLADSIASDSVLRTNKVGSHYAARPNALLSVVLGFKSFMLKGLNARTVRLFHEMHQGKGIDNAMRILIGTGLTGVIYAGTVHYNSLGLPEHRRADYKARMLNPAVVAYQAVSRSAELGSGLGAINLGFSLVSDNDIFKAGRSTIDPASQFNPKPLRSDAVGKKESGEILGKRLGSFIPASTSVGAAAALTLDNIPSWLNADAGYQADMQKRAIFENLGQLAPNSPEVQYLINQIAAGAGAAGANMY